MKSLCKLFVASYTGTWSCYKSVLVIKILFQVFLVAHHLSQSLIVIIIRGNFERIRLFTIKQMDHPALIWSGCNEDVTMLSLLSLFSLMVGGKSGPSLVLTHEFVSSHDLFICITFTTICLGCLVDTFVL